MHKLLDLRFIIGLFFTIIGILLLLHSFISGGAEAQSINRWSSIIFIIFGIGMILLSFGKDAKDELLENDQ